MKIKNISCTQFAGVHDRDVSFTDGINVIYGKNESGKSTLVNLISRTLFQDVKLNHRSNRDFFELYFPSAKKGSSIAGDFADGKITLEAKDGTYTLSKEWGTDARCFLSTPDGVIRDQSKISEILKEVVLYGEAVYSDILFSSQCNVDASLKTILDASKSETKQELADAVSHAFAESDGISIDAIEQAIMEKIDEISGKHWDFGREAPVRRAGRWSNGLGEILKVYYLLENAREDLDEISQLEREADLAAKAYEDKDVETRTAEDAYSRFNTFSSRLAVQSERNKTIDRINTELQKKADVLSKWPQLIEKLEKAKKLQTEIANRNVLDVWNFIKKTRDELSEEDYAVAELPYPDSAEILNVRNLQCDIIASENKLCGMNLNAVIHMLGDNKVQIVSLRTGENVNITNGCVTLTEAVKITIPGVMEMQLSPADVDIVSIETCIAQLREAIDAIFAKYKVETLEELETNAQKIGDARAKIESVNTRIARALGNTSLAQLEELYRQSGPVNRSKEEIDDDIFAICGSADVATYIAKAETVVDGYAAEYWSML